MQFGKGRKLNIKFRSAAIVVALSVIVLIALTVGIAAKYVTETRGKKTQLSALDFYFTVDILGDTNEYDELETEVHLFGGGDKTFTFNVQNFFDELRINDKDISYTAKIESSDPGYNLANFTLTPSDYVMAAASGAHSDKFTISFPTGYEAAGKTVTVCAKIKATSPYVKEMKINFVLHSEEADVTYRVEDTANSNVATLIVMTNKDIAAGKINVDWSSVNSSSNVLQIDTTSPQVLDGTVVLGQNDPNGSFLKEVTTTKALKAGESMQIYFFKSNPALDFSKPDTAVTATDGLYNIEIVQN